MSKLLGHEAAIKNKNIISVQINLLNKCLSKCKSCKKYTWPNDELSVDDIKNVLLTLKNNFGLQSVFFSGGDPIIYKNLKEVIKFCVENKIAYSLITTLITNDIELLELLANTAYRIHVSVDAVEKEMYKEIRGVDAFDIVSKNISFVNSIRLKNKKIPIRISSTISIFNWQSILDLYNFAKNKKCLINYYLVHTFDELKMSLAMIDYFYDCLDIIAEDEKRNKKVITNAKSLLISKYDFATESEKCNRCYLPTISTVINSNGDIYPCCKLLDDVGEYNEQSKFAIGNICKKSEKRLLAEFNRRLSVTYPINNLQCSECVQRYDGLLADLEKIIEDKKEVLFL